MKILCIVVIGFYFSSAFGMESHESTTAVKLGDNSLQKTLISVIQKSNTLHTKYL